MAASTSGSKNEWGEEVTNEADNENVELSEEYHDGGKSKHGGSSQGSVEDSDGVQEEESDEDFDEDYEEAKQLINTEPDLIIDNIKLVEQESCLCRHFCDKLSPLNLLESMTSVDLNLENVDCHIDNIIRCCLHILKDESTSNTQYRVALVDLFYRIRHEFCFKLLCRAFNLPVVKSDTPFRQFGIDSDRTPDLIVELNGVLIVIEVTAVGSSERGAISKGVEQMGFESKYKLEMDLLKESGRSCKYIPIIFNMSDHSCPYDPAQMAELDVFFVRSKSNYNFMIGCLKKMSIFSTEIKTFLILPSVQLFSKAVPIKKDHPTHSFIYKIERTSNVDWVYKELVISPEVYRKVSQEWSRFDSIIVNRDIPNELRVRPIINLQNNKVDIERDPQGIKAKDLSDIIQNGDKLNFFKWLRLKTSSSYYDPTNSEKGVKIIFKERKANNTQTRSEASQSILSNINVFCAHKTTLYVNDTFNLESYSKYIDNDESMFMNYYDFDNNYEDLILEKMKEFDIQDPVVYGKMKGISLLGTMSSLDIDIDHCFCSIKEDFINMNTPRDEIPLIKLKMKQPFLLPIACIDAKDYCGLSFKNTQLIEEAMNALTGGNQYTLKILAQAKSDRYTFYRRSKPPSKTLIDLKNDRIRVSNEVNSLQREIYKRGTSDGVLRLSKTQDHLYKSKYVEIKKKMAEINKIIRERSSVEGVTNNTDFIRLPSKGSSLMSTEYKKEMEHFRSKNSQATTEGVGIRSDLESDFKNDKEIFHSINEALTVYCGENPDPLMDKYVSEDAKLLQDLKKAALDEYSPIIDSIKNSRLGHSAAFISRLAHSLMFYSQMSFNSDYIRVDNLGYKNVLLIVKGGKKIFKSKSSKLFRLICPLIPEALNWYTTGHSEKGSSIFFKHSGEDYIITPWTLLNESILTDAISFYPRVCSFVALNLNPKMELPIQYNKVSLNVLLAFHNRRQTEVLLANMRYILLSTMGDYTGVVEILKDFFSFNYDCFQSFIRSCILFNYPNYFKQLMKLKSSKTELKDINTNDFKNVHLKNIFTGEVIYKVEDLTLMIYSTFLMTKAPYQKIVERANNLKSILHINELYSESTGLRLTPSEQYSKINVELKKEDSYEDYAQNLFSNDFNFDAKYCALTGSFIDSEFMSRGLKEEIYSKWYSILSSSWDELATSTGLRGDYNDVEDFWGQKGYFIVYKSLLSNKEYNEMLCDLLYSNKTDNEKRSLLRRLNVSFLDKVNDDREFLIFHAVDKVQWRGGREIYVMDLFTKTLQQPIEKFMGYLCKFIDNELISIPSDRRSQVIHHAIFEKDLPLKDTLNLYLTLDCTKWAPKSIFIKFITTILPMQSLPNSFKTHFINYSEKLFYKRIYFNTKEVEVLMNNINYTKLCQKYLIKDDIVNGYYMLMPYSWVMGIFNYTSSFLHAINQRYFSHLISNNSMMKYGEETVMFMFAHSDDSGGRLTTTDWHLAQRALILYEINLKCCNHLLSKKKSVISRIYFEILSIIYLFKRLMALLPKFLGGLRFLPTDKGPCQDLSQSYSKCIEVMIAGANFSIAYIVLKVYSMMVWRFYFNQSPVQDDYRRPVQYMGLPDSHPLMILLTGSESDIIRIYKTNKSSLEKVFKFSNRIMLTIDEPTPIKPYKFSIKVKNIKRGFEDHLNNYSDALDSWSIRNVNYHNSSLNCLNFLNKLRDSGFVGSLVNESTTRRFSRSYFMRSQESLMTKFGLMRISEVLDCLRLFQGFSTEESAIKMVLDNVLSPDEIDMIYNDINLKNEELHRVMKVIEETCYSPLKIYKYLDNLGLKGRKLTPHIRTLKPTVVQLVKSTSIFSSKFDPPSLVSYIKEPKMRWAIPDVRGLFTAESELETFLTKKGFCMSDMDPDSLLKICRDFGPNGTKIIYLYSRVPHELRQIKSYSAFLTYLSLNTFDNLEIQGLTLKLTGAEMSTGYAMSNINEDIYEINNILSLISVLFNKLDIEFFKNLQFNCVNSINWGGGTISEFLGHLEKSYQFDVHYCYFLPQLTYANLLIKGGSRSAEVLNSGAYYTFLKSQKLKKGWYGKGELYIMIERSFYSLNLYNNQIVSVTTNKVGKVLLHHFNYIKDVCDNVGVDLMKMSKVRDEHKNTSCTFFGFDYSGQLSITTGREAGSGAPCTICSYRGGFIDELYNYSIVDYCRDVVSLRCDLYDEPIFKKVFTLPLRKAEVLQSIRDLLNPDQFKVKLDTMGLDSFEDFIYTEILTEYGGEITVGFTELFDNYSASKIFSIFSKSVKDNITLIPKNPMYSNFPASEGSLTKIFVDYSNHSGDMVIDTRKELNSAVMRVRSEYPEQMGVILAEKLVEYYEIMYTKEERKEISDEYHKLFSDDVNVVRNSVIKLMTYWGYGGLVNSIQNFSLIRDPKNYKYFNTTIISQGNTTHHSKLFEDLMFQVFEEMKDWASNYASLDFYSQKLKNKMGMQAVITNYIRYICVSCYMFLNLEVCHDLVVLQFNNTLLALLKDEDFCSSLQLRLSNNYILGSLLINYKHREDFVVLINTLRLVWCKANRVDYGPNLTEKLERLPDNVPNWKSLSRRFKHTIVPYYTYYQGAIGSLTVEEILRRSNCEIRCGNDIYRISSKLAQPSKISIPVSTAVEFKRPIKSSLLEDDLWEDLKIELDTEDPYQESVDELLEEIGNLYAKKVTRVQVIQGLGKRVFATIKWLIYPMRSCNRPILNFLRQTGENVVLVTTSYLNLNTYFKKAKTRIIEFEKGEMLLCYALLQDELNNDEFVNRLIGPTLNFLTKADLENLYSGLVRNSGGAVVESSRLGTFIDSNIMSGETVFQEDEGITAVVGKSELTQDEEKVEPEHLEYIKRREKRIKVYKEIENLKDKGLSNELCERLKSKYIGLIQDYKMSIEVIMNSLKLESSLNALNSDLKTGALSLTSAQYKQSFLAPKYNTLAHGVSTYNNNAIKNKSVKAELDSLHDEIAGMVGSGIVLLSKTFKKVIDANYKMWKNMVKSTSYKKENKSFLIVVFTTLLSCCKVVDDVDNDDVWQSVVNKISMYITDDPDSSDDEMDDLMNNIKDIIPGSKILYKPKGF